MIDDQDRCEWVNVSSGVAHLGSPGQNPKSRKTVVVVVVLLTCRCGKCRRYMKLIMAKPVRLHCASCDETLNVPQNCNIRLNKELRCPLDDYELLYCTTGTSGKVLE